MPRHVAFDFATAGGVADVDGIAEIESGHQLGDIRRIGVLIVACERLRGTAVTAPVLRDDALAAREEKHHLYIPIVERCQARERRA